MPYRYTTRDRGWWPVRVSVPPEESGQKPYIFEFEVEFRLVKRSEAKDIAIDTDKDVALRHILDWRKLVDAEGREIPYSAEMLFELLDVPWVFHAIVVGFYEAHTGVREKNSGR